MVIQKAYTEYNRWVAQENVAKMKEKEQKEQEEAEALAKVPLLQDEG